MVTALKRDTLGIDLLHSIAGEVEETLAVTQGTHSPVLAPSPCLFLSPTRRRPPSTTARVVPGHYRSGGGGGGRRLHPQQG